MVPPTQTVEQLPPVSDITLNKRDAKQLKKGKGKDQGKVLTGVKFDGRANSKVIVGERKVRTTAGVKFDPISHKRITHVFKEAAPLDSRWAGMSLENLKDEMKVVINQIKELKKSGAPQDQIAAKKNDLKEMKRVQDSINASTSCGEDNPFLGAEIQMAR